MNRPTLIMDASTLPQACHACLQIGTVPAGSTALVVWQMTSTLQGSLRPRNVSMTVR